MAYTDISTASEALSLIDRRTISSANESSKEAEMFRLHYENTKKNALSRRWWTFNQSVEDVSLENATPKFPRYKYQYIAPADCLRIKGMFDINGYEQDFRVMNGRILSNTATGAKVLALFNLIEAEHPTHFHEYLVSELALKFAQVLNPAKLPELKPMRDETLRDAIARDTVNPPIDLLKDEDSKWLQARFWI